MAIADALSEPVRPPTRDQVMLKGHKLNPGQYGTHTSPPETRSQYVDVSLGVLCTPSFIYEWTSRACPFPDDGGNSRCPFINKGVVCLMRSRIHSTMWWNDLRRFRGASVQQAWHANLTKVSKKQGGRQTRRPRRQHSSLQWLIRLVTYTMVSLCSLLQACRLLAATIPYGLLPTMGYHSWEWT